ncbi:MAG: iron-sulfur cluster assembly scaffold protein [Deltaproteobacteria bacterium]|nr:iron-sulfur cluster assembly scaffold protein [Deltaproteobacteria bacterium]
MSNNLDAFVKNLQDQIFDETRAVYGDIAFQRWLKPLYMGAIDKPDGYGRVTGSCGDTIQISLKFENNKVKKALFETNGCMSSTVCGSFAAELSLEKSPDEILDITGESILKKMGGLPEEDQHCAFLSASALHTALNDYMIKEAKRVGA